MDSKKKVESGENIPLSFYFDLSGSMNEYIRMLSVMALRILKKDVKVIIGFNQNAYVQVNNLSKSCTCEEFEQIMLNLEKLVGLGNYGLIFGMETDKYARQIESLLKKIELEKLNGIEIDKYLIDKKAEKVVIFSDFDPKDEVENLSKHCEVYWFCYRNEFRKEDLIDFKGKFFKTQSEKDIIKHLQKIDSKVYEKKQRESGEDDEYQYDYNYRSNNIRYNNNKYNNNYDDDDNYNYNNNNNYYENKKSYNNKNDDMFRRLDRDFGGWDYGDD